MGLEFGYFRMSVQGSFEVALRIYGVDVRGSRLTVGYGMRRPGGLRLGV